MTLQSMCKCKSVNSLVLNCVTDKTVTQQTFLLVFVTFQRTVYSNCFRICLLTTKSSGDAYV